MADKKESHNPDLGWLYTPEFSENWHKTRLYSLATWINGMAFRDINFSDHGRPVIKIAEIKNGIAGQTKFTNEEYEQVYLIKKGDMLFAWSGQPETSLDVYYWKGSDGWLNQHIYKVLPNTKQCDPRYFYYILKYLKPNFIAIARNKQTTGLGHVTKADLERIEVAIPTITEQKTIAHVLGTLDDKIELNRRMNETLEEMARAIFKSWFVDFDPVRAKSEGRDTGLLKEISDLFPNSFVDSELGEIPEAWESVQLSDVIEVNPKRSLQRGKVAPYLEMSHMPTQSSRPLSWESREFTSGMRFRNGDTLLARITPCLENGKTAYVDFLNDDQVGWGSTEYIVLKSKPPLPDEFSYFLARNKDFRSFAIGNMTGTSGRQRVPADSLLQYPITVPSTAIGDIFGKFARSTFNHIKQNDNQSRILMVIRDSLLPKLISGDIFLKS